MDDFIKKALPWIGAAITGGAPAIAGMAAKALGDAIGAKVDPTEAGLTAAISAATPEQLLAAKKADQEFAVSMREFGYKEAVELAESDRKDRESARGRSERMHDWTPNVLAVLMLLGWAGINYALMTMPVPEANAALVNRMLGTTDAMLMAAWWYIFGSTRQSAHKTNLLASKAKD